MNPVDLAYNKDEGKYYSLSLSLSLSLSVITTQLQTEKEKPRLSGFPDSRSKSEGTLTPQKEPPKPFSGPLDRPPPDNQVDNLSLSGTNKKELKALTKRSKGKKGATMTNAGSPGSGSSSPTSPDGKKGWRRVPGFARKKSTDKSPKKGEGESIT